MENANMSAQKPFTGLWNRVKYQRGRKYSLWHNLDIPAKLFYRISHEINYNLLIIKGKPPKKQLQKAWFGIIDSVFEYRKDGRSRNIQSKQVQIALLNYKIEAIKAIIGVLYHILLTEKQQKDVINSLKRVGIYLKNSSQEQIKRVLQRDLKAYKTKLKIEIDRLKEMMKPLNKDVVYEQTCLSLSLAIGLKLDINMTLGEFLAAENIAKEITNTRRKNAK